MLTIQASGYKRKAANLEQTLAKRYMKTVQRITEAKEDLEKLTVELSLQDEYSSGYLMFSSGLQIAEEKKASEDAITEHNAVVGEADKLPPSNELLAEDNYSWKWECHGDMVQKKKVYDKVMLLTRLKEEAVILVHEVKQHSEYMRSVAGKIDHLSSQLSEGITGQSSTEALTERGREGLLCVLKKQLHKVKAQQAMARIAYQCILGQQTVSLDDSSEEQPSDSSSSTDEEL
ncbi:Glycerol metabolism operon regulatory protein [Dissostichus eleginoides]|uniref:Glycerol metabolism operon regulatory protein n=1 Tax=Dissostichus eleginoides TaxID=100907 RepID=A0AAD9CLV2_DISEL|nr:Glycerol metabolism operon regulatory protein [Dissostichus eleginoides]